MNIKLTKRTERALRIHIAEWASIPDEEAFLKPSDVTHATIEKLINQMVKRQGEQCNLAEDYLE